MGIFSRMNDIINSNLNTLLDKAEDPQKIIRLVIQEMEDTLVEVRSDAARTIADKKKRRRRLDLLQREARDWESKAELALRKDREDLARAALTEKRTLEHAIKIMEEDLLGLEEQLQKLNEDIGHLQQKLDDAKARHASMRMKQNTVAGRLRTRNTLHDERIRDAMSRFEAITSKMEYMESKVEAYDLGQARSLEKEFAELEAQDGIEDELDKLKDRLANKK